MAAKGFSYHGKHWTQTPEGKKKLSKLLKGKKHNGSSHREEDRSIWNQIQEEAAFQNHVAYSFGRIEAWLEHYATASGISGPSLTNGVAALLHRKAHGQVFWADNNVPGLRRTPAKKLGRPPKVEVASGARKNGMPEETEIILPDWMMPGTDWSRQRS